MNREGVSWLLLGLSSALCVLALLIGCGVI